jgi:hypothetical protein
LGNRTPDLRITSASLCPTELRRRGRPQGTAAHRVYRSREPAGLAVDHVAAAAANRPQPGQITPLRGVARLIR